MDDMAASRFGWRIMRDDAGCRGRAAFRRPVTGVSVVRSGHWPEGTRRTGAGWLRPGCARFAPPACLLLRWITRHQDRARGRTDAGSGNRRSRAVHDLSGRAGGRAGLATVAGPAAAPAADAG